MITFKGLCIEEVDCFWNLLNALDIETNYMMYEPKERVQCTNIQELRADIVVGILRDYAGKRIGTTFFKNLDKWASQHGGYRLELTVECHNHVARHLYEKSGFKYRRNKRKINAY